MVFTRLAACTPPTRPEPKRVNHFAEDLVFGDNRQQDQQGPMIYPHRLRLGADVDVFVLLLTSLQAQTAGEVRQVLGHFPTSGRRLGRILETRNSWRFGQVCLFPSSTVSRILKSEARDRKGQTPGRSMRLKIGMV